MDRLIQYLDASKSPYHVARFGASILSKEGFTEIDFNSAFDLRAGGRYFVRPYPTALFAFVMPSENQSVMSVNDFRIACAHTDFPTFKIKPSSEHKVVASCKRINTEPYGGMLKKTWFDRPLGIAGMVVTKGADVWKPNTNLFDSEEAWCYIPSLAPHMDREIEKKEVDVAKDMIPITGITADSLIENIAKKLGVDEDDILSYDLNLYDTTKAEYVGVCKEFLSSGRIDNVASVAALTEAISSAENHKDSISLIALFDNEEIGSRTKQGADSKLLSWTIKKICEAIGIDYKNSLHRSMMLSVDGAHAVHPNYPDKADATTAVELGGGLVIKTSASQRYVSDPVVTGIIKGICQERGIAHQVQANKSGTPGGQTLGPIVSSYVPIQGADIGVPMLAMHSIREMISVNDYRSLEAFIKAYL